MACSEQQYSHYSLSLDAEKAFDRGVELLLWNILHLVDNFCSGLGFYIFTYPTAAVITNWLTSSFFQISRGTKRGDSLPPAIFTIAWLSHWMQT